MTTSDTVTALIAAGRALGDAGLAPGTSGNLSMRTPDGVIVTGTGARLAALTDTNMAHLGPSGDHRAGPRPTKEVGLHVGVYASRPEVGAIVHVHSPAAAAVSCLASLADVDPLPVYTPYYAMRVGRLTVVDYHAPGSSELADAVAEGMAEADATLLRQHGIVCAGKDLSAAVAATEELEANCALHLRLVGLEARSLTSTQIAELAHWRR